MNISKTHDFKIEKKLSDVSNSIALFDPKNKYIIFSAKKDSGYLLDPKNENYIFSENYHYEPNEETFIILDLENKNILDTFTLENFDYGENNEKIQYSLLFQKMGKIELDIKDFDSIKLKNTFLGFIFTSIMNSCTMTLTPDYKYIMWDYFNHNKSKIFDIEKNICEEITLFDENNIPYYAIEIYGYIDNDEFIVNVYKADEYISDNIAGHICTFNKKTNELKKIFPIIQNEELSGFYLYKNNYITCINQNYISFPVNFFDAGDKAIWGRVYDLKNEVILKEFKNLPKNYEERGYNLTIEGFLFKVNFVEVNKKIKYLFLFSISSYGEILIYDFETMNIEYNIKNTMNVSFSHDGKYFGYFDYKENAYTVYEILS